MEFVAKKESDLEKISSDILGRVLEIKESGADGGAVVVGLYGDLGSGKTTFTKYFANQLGIDFDQIISPTFIIQKRFKISDSEKNSDGAGKQFDNLYHLDVYRIETPEEIKKLNWKEIISDPKNIILIEWANLIEEILPKGTSIIKFETISETERKITTDF